jgi:ABC-type histidine transport system ATPase subunit
LILVNHELSFVANVAHQVVFMDAGRVVEKGPPETILGSPRSKRVQEFISKIRSGFTVDGRRLL